MRSIERKINIDKQKISNFKIDPRCNCIKLIEQKLCVVSAVRQLLIAVNTFDKLQAVLGLLGKIPNILSRTSPHQVDYNCHNCTWSSKGTLKWHKIHQSEWVHTTP